MLKKVSTKTSKVIILSGCLLVPLSAKCFGIDEFGALYSIYHDDLQESGLLAKWLKGSSGTSAIYITNDTDKNIDINCSNTSNFSEIDAQSSCFDAMMLPAHTTTQVKYTFGGGTGAGDGADAYQHFNSGGQPLITATLKIDKWRGSYDGLEVRNANINPKYIIYMIAYLVPIDPPKPTLTNIITQTNCTEVTVESSTNSCWKIVGTSDKMKYATLKSLEPFFPTAPYKEWITKSPGNLGTEYGLAELNYPMLMQNGYYAPASVANIQFDNGKKVNNNYVIFGDYSQAGNGSEICSEYTSVNIDYVGPKNKIWSDPTNNWVDISQMMVRIYLHEDINLLSSVYADNPFTIDIGYFDSSEKIFKPLRWDGDTWVEEPANGWTTEQPFSAEGMVYAVAPVFANFNNYSIQNEWYYRNNPLFNSQVSQRIVFTYISSKGHATLFYANNNQIITPSNIETLEYPSSTSKKKVYYTINGANLYEEVFTKGGGQNVDYTYTTSPSLSVCTDPSQPSPLVARKIPYASVTGQKAYAPGDVKMAQPPGYSLFFNSPKTTNSHSLSCFKAASNSNTWSATGGSQRNLSDCLTNIENSIENGFYTNSQGLCTDSNDQKSTGNCYKIAFNENGPSWFPPEISSSCVDKGKTLWDTLDSYGASYYKNGQANTCGTDSTDDSAAPIGISEGVESLPGVGGYGGFGL